VDNTTVTGRAILARDAVYISDFMADPDYGMKNFATASAFRSTAAVPLLRDGVPVGAITIGRLTLGDFSAAQIELLKTFAEQAAIAATGAETYRAFSGTHRRAGATQQRVRRADRAAIRHHRRAEGDVRIT
jgi:two-component system NtrC family sensor kinase